MTRCFARHAVRRKLPGNRGLREVVLTLEERVEFDIVLVATETGDVLSRRPVSASQLAAAAEELRFAVWRQSAVDDPRELLVAERVVYDEPLSCRVAGVQLSTRMGDRTWERWVGPKIFQSSADSLLAELVRSGRIAADSKVDYHVETRVVATHHTARATIVCKPTPLGEGRLADYLGHSVPCGPLDPEDYPVFVLDSALDAAHQHSWKGRTVEAGAWLVGRLVRQRQPTAEIFGVIDTAIQACDAVHERTSLKPSTRSFRHFELQLAVRRKRLGRENELAMGFHHSHPFLPSLLDGKEACPACSLRAECELSSSFFSLDDAQFHRAVFGSAPYTVQMVLGLTPREEFDLRMFCGGGGQFRERGYYRLSHLPKTT